MAAKILANILEDHSANFGSKEAISDGKISLTYQELNDSCIAFAGYLIKKGVMKGDRIVFLYPKEAPLFLAIFGTFKAGAIYVPLDYAWPIRRLVNIIEELQARVIITNEKIHSLLREQLNAEVSFILPDEIRSFLKGRLPESLSDKTILPKVTEKDDAYCLYTSGSTGKPKGVLIQYSCIGAFFKSIKALMGINRKSHCLNTSPLHFDVSLLDTFFPLYSGAWVRLYCEIFLPNLFLKLIEQHRITHFCAVSPVLALMAKGSTSFDEHNLTSLQRIMTGAESPDIYVVQKWLNKVPNLTIINGYGPTEATCVCLAYAISKREPSRTEPYPIGNPLEGIDVILIDENNSIIKQPHLKGELLISGAQVMKGYWNQPVETKNKLVNINGSTYYRSGDICEYLPDGNLFFVGRVDEEIKLSGYRINLNEIIHNVEKLKFIREAAVCVVSVEKNHKELALCVGPKAQLSNQRILFIEKRLLHDLPIYFCPKYYFILNKIPRLSSNKVDKKKLDQMIRATLDINENKEAKYFFQNKNGSFDKATDLEK